MQSIKKYGIVSSLAVAMAFCGALLLQVGCATEDDTINDDSIGETTQAVTHSFTDSCEGDGYSTNSQPVQAITHAWASRCRKPGGTWGGPQDWRGLCFTDLSNCNGTLVCQNHCP